jgi:hypothetical protein
MSFYDGFTNISLTTFVAEDEAGLPSVAELGAEQIPAVGFTLDGHIYIVGTGATGAWTVFSGATGGTGGTGGTGAKGATGSTGGVGATGATGATGAA